MPKEKKESIREIRQEEAMLAYLKSNRKSLLKCAPRFGKIKVTLDILKNEDAKDILVLYPRVDIKEGWLKDIEKWNFPEEIKFQTFKSIKKELKKPWKWIIIDEIHEASKAQLQDIKTLLRDRIGVLALSGTVTNKTQNTIRNITGIKPCYDYSIELAVEEGILCDYDIFIHEVNLDSKFIKYNGKTEKRKFRDYAFVKEKLQQENKPTFFLELKQISLIQNSKAKLDYTKLLLERYKDQRVLVFCGTTNIADQMGIPVYHSKSKEVQLFKDFCDGIGNHLVTIKMAQSGITVTPIDVGIINYTSGNPEDTAQKICRFLGFEYNNPNKKAQLHIISTKEPFERDRLKTSLMFFAEDKIHYI